MKKHFLILLLILIASVNVCKAQARIDVKKILDEFGNTARAYLLSANRPAYGVSSYTVPKNKISIDIGASFNNDFVDVPVSMSYGLAGNFELQAGLPVYTQSYDFSGNKINGMGDANIGFKYKFHESENFEHALQLIVKLPTASSKTQLGTGKFDFHLGAAQGFYYRNFSYDLSIELNFLKRRDFPDIKNVPRLLQPALDSILHVYQYKYEQEMVFSFSPAYYISEYFVVYSGTSFSRNFKLDYNSLQLFGGFGYSLSEKVSVSAGATFSMLNEKSWAVSTGINFLF